MQHGPKTGRPSKLTAESRARIVQAIAAGNTRDMAAACAGVHRATFFAWLKRGEQEISGTYRDFYDAIKKAEADAVAGSVEIIRQAAHQSWQAAAWFLERRYPRDWGRKPAFDLDQLIRHEVERLTSGTDLDPEEVIDVAESFLENP